MIVPMSKIFVAVRGNDRDRFMEALRDFGAFQLVPVAPDKAVAQEEALHLLQHLTHAAQLLANIEPSDHTPDLDPHEAAEKALDAFHKIPEYTTRHTLTEHHIAANSVWGCLCRTDIQEVCEAGLIVGFYRVPAEDFAKVEASCVEDLGPASATHRLIAIACRDRDRLWLPASTEEVEAPLKDLPTLKAEAINLEIQIGRLESSLHDLANLKDAVKAEANKVAQEIYWTVAVKSGVSAHEVFAVTGWIPETEGEKLTEKLESAGIPAAVRTSTPDPDENPPTLVQSPGWARPIEGLFKILGTIPGYREFDMSASFLIALPIFSAMLIADGGYGLLLLLAGILGYKKISEKAGPQLAQLAMIIGGVSILWGFAISSFFGFGDADFTAAGGLLANIGALLAKLKLIEGTFTADTVVRDVMRLSFVIGTIHMSLGRLWLAARLFPSLKALAAVGWAIFLWGMLFVVQTLVLELPFPAIGPYLLGGGSLLVIGFTNPQKNILKTIGYGFADLPLSALSTLSDTISYIRLMAVGLASTILAATFNGLAAEVAVGGTWIAGALVLIIGHGLNIGLAVIALFAHGVRLNMLEFSQTLGMAWNGTKYKPFSSENAEEI
jgi:V/A-type H+/Na+-transporting ATPase subunit I